MTGVQTCALPICTWKAIKLRIHADIQARAPGVFSKRTLGIFFSRYTTTTAYLKALAAPDTQRFDLDGQPAGEIAEEHRAAAVEELARRREMQDARRAAEREAHRQARVQTRPRDAQPVPAPGDAPQGTPPPRPQRFAQGPRPARPPRSSQPTPQPRQAKQRAAAATAEPVVPAPASPDDAARRERALLWRAFESSTLTKANFCVLKRIDAVTLDAALAQARKEQAERGFAEPAQPAHEHRLGPRRG